MADAEPLIISSASCAHAAGGMLLDRILPEFDFRNRHAIIVAAPVACVAEALETSPPLSESSAVVRLLLRLRGLTPSSEASSLRASMTGRGFTVLAERPGEEFVLGIAGRFWAFDEAGNLLSLPDAKAFTEFNQPGTAKAAVNVRLEALSAGTTRLSTETRVKCVDGTAHRRFMFYWALIKPFSGWIRREMLRSIQRRALALGG